MITPDDNQKEKKGKRAACQCHLGTKGRGISCTRTVYRVPCTGISWKTIVEWLAPPPKGSSLTDVFHEARSTPSQAGREGMCTK
ncbi:hypothetical protein OUZ56_011430 [Daphnia magna]|uniref:Uncharacterized protein n=1 Tax=Daphnia magna TaxID=35525 RepID=A0ABQ9Z041_9CRUS|nr:hypothetical protein OUZ56_011430 [Daphnia magna]